MKLMYLVLISILMVFQATASVQDPGSVSAGLTELSGHLLCLLCHPRFLVRIIRDRSLFPSSCQALNAKRIKHSRLKNRPVDFVVTVTNKGPSATET